MKKVFIFTLFTLLSASLWAISVGPMNYQGRLLDSNGIPITNISPGIDMVVKIYDDPSAGVLQYQETFLGVQVNDGVYSFKIGAQTPDVGIWDLNLWQQNLNDLYIELVVDAETLSPRHELTSAPHAFTSTFALAADQLGTKTSSDFDNIIEGLCAAGNSKWLEKVERCVTEDFDFSGSTWSDFTNDNDFSGLYFSGANFTGADFSGVNFSRTEFKGSNDFTGANLTGANFSYASGAIIGDNATLDNANFSSTDGFSVRMFSITASFNGINLYNAYLSLQSDLQLDVSNATYNRTRLQIISMGPFAPPCPTLPVGWTCKSDMPIFPPGQAGGTNGIYVFGPNIKMSNVKTTDTFSGEDLSSAYLVGAEIDATFDQTDLSGTLFNTSTIRKSDFITNDLTSARFPSTSISWTNFYQSIMDHQWAQAEGFYDSTIDHTTFEEISFNEGYFYGSVITNSVFRKINNTYGPYIGAFISVSFYGAKMDNVRFLDSDLSGASFRWSHLMNVRFADITGAVNLYFQDAVIDNTVFTNVDLGNAQFDNARLYDVTFFNSDLTNADFSGASLENVIWDTVTCPDGNPETNGANTSSCEDQL